MTNQAQNIELNIAEQQRNANRDYYELNLPISMKVYMATRSDEELDRVALGNQRMFKYRFGLNANSVVRTKIIAIKNRYNLTDIEVKTLIKSGQIRVNQNKVLVTPDKVSPIIGFVILVIISFVCGINLFAITGSSSVSVWGILLALGTILSVWGICIYHIKKFMVAPWQTLKHSGVLKDLPKIKILDSLRVRSFTIE